MTIEQLNEMWADDGRIDPTQITDETARIPLLHNKYFTLLVQNRRKLRLLQTALKKLRIEKYEFLTNPTEYHIKELQWELPAQGRLLKNETQQYIDSDKQVIEAELKVGAQQDVCDMLKSIVDTIMTRGFLIKSLLEDRRYLSGN